MKSPFPGMDPYLEARWSDVHVKLITFIAESLQSALPGSLRARAEEKVLLESEMEQEEPLPFYRSDVAVVDIGRRSTGGTAVAPEPTDAILVDYHAGPSLDRFVQIIDRTSGNRVVTVIEVLSPWNKEPGRLNSDYFERRGRCVREGINIVEIGLIRRPRREAFQTSPLDLPKNRRTPCITCIRRAGAVERWEVYTMSLRQPLPIIPIPLRHSDKDVMLNLQPLIERVYVSGGHDDIDYSQPCFPPLDKDNAAWAADLLKSVSPGPV